MYYQITIAELKPYWKEQTIIMKSENKSNLIDNIKLIIYPGTITILNIKEIK
tara:strand:+ start:676 stop:831 length:156 start_codon:yes stop_codon:yes gene_type:complete